MSAAPTRRLESLAVFGLAAAPRLAYLYWARPDFIERYWLLATSLLQRGTLAFDGVPDTGYEPLYAIVLAAARRLVGDRPLAVQTLQVLVAAAGGVLLFRLAGALTMRRRVAWIAAGLYAVYPLLVRHAAAPDPYTVLSTLLLAFAIAALRARDATGMAAAGVWLGLAALTRAAVLPIALLMGGALLVGRRPRLAAALVVVTTLMCVPLVVRNHLVNGSWMPTRSGMNLFVANSRYTAALLPREHPDLLQEYAISEVSMRRPQLAEQSPLDPDLDAALRRAALRTMAEHPWRLAVLKMRSVAYFFWPRLVPSRVPTEGTVLELEADGRVTVRGSAPRPRLDEIAYTATYVPVLLLAAAGVIERRTEGRDVGTLVDRRDIRRRARDFRAGDALPRRHGVRSAVLRRRRDRPVARLSRRLDRMTTDRARNLAVFLLALVPRLGYVFAGHPRFQFEHWDLATSIVQHGTLGFAGVPTTRFEPLYPLFIAGLRTLTGGRVVAAQCLQAAVGAFAAVALYHLTVALTSSRRAAMAAAMVFACYPLSIRHAGDGTDTTLMGTWLVFFCWAFVRSRSPRDMAVAGLVLGVTTLTRTMALPLLALSSMLLIVERRGREAAVLVSTTLLLYAPYAVRNYRLNGTLMPTRTGINLFVSNSPYTDQLVPEYHADVLESFARSIVVAHGLPPDLPSPAIERDRDELLTRIALGWMREHPWRALWRRVAFAGYFLSPFVVPQRDSGGTADVEFPAAGTVTVADSPRRPALVRAIYTLSFTPILLLSIVGAWARRSQLRRDGVLWCVLVTFLAAHSVFFPATRYRTPMSFVLIFFAVAGARALWGRYSSGATPVGGAVPAGL